MAKKRERVGLPKTQRSDSLKHSRSTGLPTLPGPSQQQQRVVAEEAFGIGPLYHIFWSSREVTFPGTTVFLLAVNTRYHVQVRYVPPS